MQKVLHSRIKFLQHLVHKAVFMKYHNVTYLLWSHFGHQYHMWWPQVCCHYHMCMMSPYWLLLPYIYDGSKLHDMHIVAPNVMSVVVPHWVPLSCVHDGPTVTPRNGCHLYMIVRLFPCKG